jgi:prenylcysteine oxidase/farnesylcysteine lyase
MTNLAVVGAGIGGCCAAYLARKYLPRMNVTIYDTQDRIGGRILTCNTSGATLELGAAFFNRFNRTLFDIIKTEKLKITSLQENRDFAVWNGSKILFRSNTQTSATILKLLAKYKLSLTRTFLLLRKARRQIAKLYHEEMKKPSDIGGLFEFTGLDKWCEKPFLDTLIQSGVSTAFIDEIVTPITRVIYSQNVELSAFAGISSLIGVYSGATYSLAKGNITLPVQLAKKSNAKIRLGQKIEVIEKTPKGNYRLHFGEGVEVFDSVIIATPLELANIRFEGLSKPDWESQSYQVVYKKVMKGVFNPDYFGLKNTLNPPSIILTTKDAHPITQYSIQKINNGESLVTISSPENLNGRAFYGVFKNGGVSVLEHYWKAAYPVFKPLTKLPPTCIDKNLMYTSAVEGAVSSMETSALSALNAVRMLG